MDPFSPLNPNTSYSSSSLLPNTNPNKPSKKKNTNNKSSTGAVKLSTDPQSVAARERRHRISDRFKILQSLVPGGSKMDTVSMLEEAINYVKFLKTQIWLHQTIINSNPVGIHHESTTVPYHYVTVNDAFAIPQQEADFVEGDSEFFGSMEPYSGFLPSQDIVYQEGDQDFMRFNGFMRN